MASIRSVQHFSPSRSELMKSQMRSRWRPSTRAILLTASARCSSGELRSHVSAQRAVQMAKARWITTASVTCLRHVNQEGLMGWSRTRLIWSFAVQKVVQTAEAHRPAD
ncbi:hypothetical protein SEVIR_9G566500v4 [Setaria viridis]|uniref:Uncharacterized protein n=2 Tax=Setaria TaxID=4554 RepID=A0A368SWR3_SETIT|nr:hypothetical protein SETIT_9G562800v2 [Setaria italica]TKV98539.1 hypothetical protein SEVIR_9G566500v2 [Setaria viridis]